MAPSTNMSSYGSINHADYQPVPSNSNDPVKDLEDLYESSNRSVCRRRLLKTAQLLGLAGLATLAVYALWYYNDLSNNNNHSSTPSQHGDGHYSPPLPVSAGQRQPLSRLHPVHDLGFPAYKRPKDSRPSSILKKDKNKPFFPTNAWYQNMLLVPNTDDTSGNSSNDTNAAKAAATTAEPTKIHRAYATPFVIDAVGPIPGLRLHPNQVSASQSIVQLNVVDNYGLTIGAAPDAAAAATTTNGNTTSATTNFRKEYAVENTTPLGLTLSWDKSFPMSSSIVKGMPFGTMVYDKTSTQKQDDDDDSTTSTTTWYPTVASEIPLAKSPIVDGGITTLICQGWNDHDDDADGMNTTSAEVSGVDEYYGNTTAAVDTLDTGNSSSTNTTRKLQQQDTTTTTTTTTTTGSSTTVTVERDIELHFKDSDFTWLVFVSRPVTIQCIANKKSTLLQVIDTTEKDTTTNSNADAPPFVMRIAVAKVCTSNKNPIYCHQEQMLPGSLTLGQGKYDELLRNHSHLVPGPHTSFRYDVNAETEQISMEFDWDVRETSDYYKTNAVPSKTTRDNDLIVYALPHHLDLMGTKNAPGYLKYCASTLIGPACLLSGSKWTMIESVPRIAFRAPRPPAPWVVADLAKAARTDIRYRLPKAYQQGQGDTYFSGKMLAKLGRVLVIVEELQELCSANVPHRGSRAIDYAEACRGIKLPTDREIRKAVDSLRESVEIWINGKAKTLFVFDDEWGGVVSCGCDNPDGGKCKNQFPDCPAFTDPGLNFGNAFYNDLHFHYGYHIYAAAVVSHFDPDWGKEFFERVLLLVRNIANPAETGDYFPAFRHKDWYQGHSWASGVVPPYLNGRNQESSSESIAAYEAVALYGAVMKSVFENEHSGENAQNVKVAQEVQKAGQILAATELRSTRRYYHVRDQGNANEALKIYPSEYSNHAIGMMWNTMAQYQTWFGAKPYFAAGIQLLPTTPIAELRDGVEWLAEMYPSFNQTCSSAVSCEENGWSVLQIAALATIGYQHEAAEQALRLPPDVFTSAGGNGHSLTNTLWYIASRPVLEEPIDMSGEDETYSNATNATSHTEDAYVITDCYNPQTCSDYVLDTIADEYSCRQRMTDLINTEGHTQEEACYMIAMIQFPEECGACNPNATSSSSSDFVPQCPPCTVSQCANEKLNRCPAFRQTFVCTDGPNTGGCSRFPWDLRSDQCDGCCELTECVKHHGFY